MVTQFGMSDKLGLVTLGRKQHEVFLGHDIVDDRNYSEEVAHTIDLEIRAIVDGSMNKAREILTENRERLEEITRLLLEKEILEGDELDELLAIRRRNTTAITPRRISRKRTRIKRGQEERRRRPGREAVIHQVPDIEEADSGNFNTPMDEEK